MSTNTADERFHDVVHAVFEAMARDPELHGGYALKGGLALWLAYGSPRRSGDFDYNAVETSANVITEETGRTLLEFCRRLDAGLRDVGPKRGFERISTYDAQLSTEIPVLLGHVGYVTEDGSDGSVTMQVSLGEIVCETHIRQYEGIPLHVASLEDIISEKLKAILQQVKRDKIRSTDVYDVWYFVSRAETRVRPENVTPILLEKRKQWPGMPRLTKSEYRQSGIVDYAESEYDLIQDSLEPGAEFVPFTEAYESVLAFVDQLKLPD